MLYDVDTEEARRRPPNPGKDQWWPRIEGDKVIWTDHRNAPGGRLDMWNTDIYMHDLSTGKTVAVTTHPAQQSYPDIQGDWVVWEDRRHNPGHPKNDLLPQIDRGRVFFQWTSDIFMVDLATLRAASSPKP